jgi:hypothetical protein
MAKPWEGEGTVVASPHRAGFRGCESNRCRPPATNASAFARDLQLMAKRG